MNHRSRIIRLAALLLALVLLGGCAGGGDAPSDTQEADARVDKTIFAMDTVMDLTPYGPNAAAAAEAAAARIMELEQRFSVTLEDSDISAVNTHPGDAVEVSTDTAALLQSALEYCRKTDGALDISIYPVLREWGFTTGEYQVPAQEKLDALLEHVDYRKVDFDASARTVQVEEDMMIDLGSVAKGYTGDQVMEVFRQSGLTSGMVSLGGNVQVLGAKPDGSPWRIAIQDPTGEGNYVGVIEVVDQAVITSGGYERYFEQDGETYWHILDPATGAPAHSGVISSSIISDSGVMGDALSTALFIMGPEKAAAFWKQYGGFDYLLVLEDGSLVISEGLADRFTPMDDWAAHPLTVVTK